MKLYRLASIFFLFVVAVFAGETLTNDSIIELQKAGLGDDLIIQKMQGSPTEFDMSTGGLRRLKDAGVSDGVIRVMMSPSRSRPQALLPDPAAAISNNPLEAHQAGLWTYEENTGKPRMRRLAPKSAGRSSGWNKKSRATLYASSAAVQLAGPLPVFYYYGSEGNAEANANDLILARMEVEEDKNERRLAVGKEDFFGGKKSGLDPLAYVSVNVEPAGPGIYKITPTQDLNRGEYCFIYRGAVSREALKHGQVDLFDFSVK